MKNQRIVMQESWSLDFSREFEWWCNNWILRARKLKIWKLSKNDPSLPPSDNLFLFSFWRNWEVQLFNISQSLVTINTAAAWSAILNDQTETSPVKDVYTVHSLLYSTSVHDIYTKIMWPFWLLKMYWVQSNFAIWIWPYCTINIFTRSS